MELFAIQVLFGAVAGIAGAVALPKCSLGRICNTLAGIIGGLLGGQIVTSAIPLAQGSPLLRFFEIAGSAAGGLAGGAMMLIIVSVMVSVVTQ